MLTDIAGDRPMVQSLPSIRKIPISLEAYIVRDVSGEVANVFNKAPDWTIEILSPAQSQTKVVKNIIHCLKHGTQMGWMIDPDDRTVLVYRPNQEIAIFDADEEMLPMPEFARSLQLTIGELFS